MTKFMLRDSLYKSFKRSIKKPNRKETSKEGLMRNGKHQCKKKVKFMSHPMRRMT